MDRLDREAIDWLLASDEPGIRMQARCDLLGEDPSADAAIVDTGPRVRALLEGQTQDGGFGVDVYAKWRGAHWRLGSLVELGIAPGHRAAVAAYETVLRWLSSPRHLRSVPVILGRARRCASQEGLALAVGVHLGLADDPRVRLLASSLIGWLWDDGGWNCARAPDTTHSSFYETALPLWGMAAYARATGDAAAHESARATAEFVLRHHVDRSHRTGEVGDPRWVGLHWPPYYGYDTLWGLVILARAGALPDDRAAAAVDWLRGRRLPDGRWPVDGPWGWRSTGLRDPKRDPAAWPTSGPSEVVTLQAMRVLRAWSSPEPDRPRP
jgi:hypothetical protein